MTAAIATALTVDYGHAELLPVHFDDLDPMGMIHNARYALLIERALATFWRHHGHTFSDGRPTTADAFNVVKEFTISYRAPIRGPGDVVVHFWLEHMGTSCAVYTFCLLSSDGTTVFAEGRRVVIKLDRETLRPSPWTPEARAVAEGLLRRPGTHKAGGRHPPRARDIDAPGGIKSVATRARSTPRDRCEGDNDQVE
jgi:acyl-CoA thioester hydrolase